MSPKAQNLYALSIVYIIISHCYQRYFNHDKSNDACGTASVSHAHYISVQTQFKLTTTPAWNSSDSFTECIKYKMIIYRGTWPVELRMTALDRKESFSQVWSIIINYIFLIIRIWNFWFAREIIIKSLIQTLKDWYFITMISIFVEWFLSFNFLSNILQKCGY